MKFEFADIGKLFTNTFQPEPYIINAYKDTHHAALDSGANPTQSRPMKGRSLFAILHLWRKGDPQPQQAKKRWLPVGGHLFVFGAFFEFLS